MATDHIRAVREIFERFNAGDLEIDPDLTHPDIEIVASASRFSGEPYRGYEGVQQWFAETFESFDEWKIQLDWAEAHGPDRVFGEGSVHLRGRGSGAVIDLPCAWIVEFDGERCTRLETFANQVEEARGRVAAWQKP